MGKDGQKRTSWDGGYIRWGKKGPVYVIEKWVSGIHFHVSTRCRSSGAAHEQWKRFQANPSAYRPSGDVVARLPITAELVLEYRDWMIAVKRNSRDWSYSCARFLADWRESFGSRDVRHVTLHGHIEPALAKWGTSRRHRIEALKAFCKWLRRKGLMKASEDPTIDLQVPAAEPAQIRKQKAVDEKRVSAVLPYLPEDARDVLLVLMASGLHLSEVRRFAECGELVKSSKARATLIYIHKNKRKVPSEIRGRVHVEAAERIKLRGTTPARWTLNGDMRTACEKAGVERFSMGVMRHSFATNAFRKGATTNQVGDALHHASPETTRRHYIDMAVPPAAVPALRVVKGGRR